jgi:hypothetical protein
LVLGEDCPASISLAGQWEELLGSTDLEVLPAHAVIVGGRRYHSDVEAVLREKMQVSFDPSGRWAARNGFLGGPLLAVVGESGVVESLMAWSVDGGLIPYGPTHSSGARFDAVGPIEKEETP